MTTPPTSHPAGQPVYLLTWTDEETDHQWFGGPVIRAQIDLYNYFGRSGRPANAQDARKFAEHCLRQLSGFPAEARRSVHELASEVLEDFEDVISALDPLLVPETGGDTR